MRKFIAALVVAASIVVAPTAQAQSSTYLHADYAKDTCHAQSRPSADATMMASVGAHVNGYEWFLTQRLGNNTVDITIRWWTSLGNYWLDAACRVSGTDVSNGVTTLAIGYVRRASSPFHP